MTLKKIQCNLIIFFPIWAAFSCERFISVWFFIELNILRFILFGYYTRDNESIIKYFFTQAIASGSLLTIYLLSLRFVHIQESLVFFITLIVYRKLGVPPFYLWFVRIVSRMRESLLIFYLCTVQKLIPLYLLRLTRPLMLVFLWLGLLATFLGSLAQTSFKKLLAYSRIFNSFWLILSAFSNYLIISFFLIYSLNLLAVLFSMNKNFLTNVNSDLYFRNIRFKAIILLIILFLRMAGIPPFWGFLSKIIVISSLIESSSNWELVFRFNLLGFTFYIIYFYIRFFFDFLNKKNFFFIEANSSHYNLIPIILIFLSLNVIFL